MTQLAVDKALCVALAVVAAAGCGSPQRVAVRFSGTPGDALVTVDDRYVGKLGRLSHSGLRLPVGSHRLTVEQVGYFPHDELIDVRTEHRPAVRVELVPIPD